LRATVPRVVVVPPFRVEKLTLPTPVDGVTVTAKLKLVPIVTFVAEGETVIELAAREGHEVARLLTSTEPRPVTRLYLVVGSKFDALYPITPEEGQVTLAGNPKGVPD
jgi:hypothetical protein